VIDLNTRSESKKNEIILRIYNPSKKMFRITEGQIMALNPNINPCSPSAVKNYIKLMLIK